MEEFRHTFKGKANSPGPGYYVGFREGWVIGYLGKPMNSGKYGGDWGSGGGVDGSYGDGFAEGRLSGWSAKQDNMEIPDWAEAEFKKYFDL